MTDKQLDCPPASDKERQYLEEISVLKDKISELRTQVMTDELTGLFNYRHMLWAMNQEIERVHRSGGAFSLIVADLDNLKAINDRHGHEFGNQVLKVVGAFLQRSLRKLDIPCRFGGDEFVLILPATDLRDAVLLAERIREGVMQMRLESDAEQVLVSVSIGVDCYHASDRLTQEGFFNRADQYLLLAKQAGKKTVFHPQLGNADGMSEEERNALRKSFGAETDSDRAN